MKQRVWPPPPQTHWLHLQCVGQSSCSRQLKIKSVIVQYYHFVVYKEATKGEVLFPYIIRVFVHTEIDRLLSIRADFPKLYFQSLAVLSLNLILKCVYVTDLTCCGCCYFRSYSYYIEVSMDELDWVRVVDHSKYLCRSWQNLYFTPRVCRWVRLNLDQWLVFLFYIGSCLRLLVSKFEKWNWLVWLAHEVPQWFDSLSSLWINVNTNQTPLF